MEYYNKNNLPPVKPSPSGSKFGDKYELKFNKKGIKELVKTGEKTNHYEKIQAQAEDVKIENILKRHLAGDMTALNAKKGQYIDITAMPTNLIEAKNAMLVAQKEFDKLSTDEKSKYGYNAMEWIEKKFINPEQTQKPVTTENVKTELKVETAQAAPTQVATQPNTPTQVATQPNTPTQYV